MDWLNSHVEIIAYVAGAVLTFTIWNVSQGARLRRCEERVEEHKEAVSEKLKTQAESISSIRSQQENVQKGLTEELRRIGEKLAHIEGFLMRKPAAKK